MTDWIPLIVAIYMWVAGYRYGVQRGERRAGAAARHSLPSPVHVELPCFGGPRDGETVRFDAACEQLRIPYDERFTQAHWGDQFELPKSLRPCRHAIYRRLWIGDREQLVYQGTVDG